MKFYFFLYNLANNNSLIGEIIAFLSSWSSLIFAFIYITGIIILSRRQSRQIIPFLLAPAITAGIVKLIRFIYLRPRPFVALEVKSLIEHAPSVSLPSMHAASAFIIGIVIWKINRNIGHVVLFLALITALSRIMVGVHYPSDIIFGILLAIFVSFFIYKLIPNRYLIKN